MQVDRDFGTVFARSWQLLSTNWVIIVPGLVIGIVAGILIAGLLASGAVTAAFGGLAFFVIAAMISGIVGMLAALLSIAYTTGMAVAAWKTGTATFADGAAAFSAEGTPIFLALLLLFVLGVVAAILTPFTLGLAMLAYALFVIYTIPAVVVDGLAPMDALRRSFDMVMKNFLTTLIIVVLIGLISWVGGLIGNLFHDIPLLGGVVQQVIQQIVIAYATLVIVGEYLHLHVLVPTQTNVPPPPVV